MPPAGTSAMLKAPPRNPMGGAAPQEGLGRGKGSGRARDVVHGQDGHDDGSNMMRVPSRRLSMPMNRISRGRVAVSGHNLQPWVPQTRSCSELLSPRCSPVTSRPQIASLAQTFRTCRVGEGRQDLAIGRHAWHADGSCSWWAEASVCPAWAPLQTGLEKAGSKAK